MRHDTDHESPDEGMTMAELHQRDLSNEATPPHVPCVQTAEDAEIFGEESDGFDDTEDIEHEHGDDGWHSHADGDYDHDSHEPEAREDDPETPTFNEATGDYVDHSVSPYGNDAPEHAIEQDSAAEPHMDCGTDECCDECEPKPDDA